MNSAQEKTIAKVTSYCPTATITDGGAGRFWVNWNNNEDHWLNKNKYMALVGKRGGFKIVVASSPLCFDKAYEKTLASLALYDLGMTGTIEIR